MWIAGFALFLLGVALIIVAPINRKKNSRCSAQTEGKLMDIRRRNHGFWYIYSYEVNGTGYQLKSPNSSPEANNVGDNCTIWYDPAKPENAQPFHYDSNKIYNIILIIGIVMVLLGIILTLYGAVKQSL